MCPAASVTLGDRARRRRGPRAGSAPRPAPCRRRQEREHPPQRAQHGVDARQRARDLRRPAGRRAGDREDAQVPAVAGAVGELRRRAGRPRSRGRAAVDGDRDGAVGSRPQADGLARRRDGLDVAAGAALPRRRGRDAATPPPGPPRRRASARAARRGPGAQSGRRPGRAASRARPRRRRREPSSTVAPTATATAEVMPAAERRRTSAVAQDVPDAAHRVQEARLAARPRSCAAGSRRRRPARSRSGRSRSPRRARRSARGSRTWRGWRRNSSSSRNSVRVSSIGAVAAADLARRRVEREVGEAQRARRRARPRRGAAAPAGARCSSRSAKGLTR